jgi:outer membrane receptor protein involved in Fe transport
LENRYFESNTKAIFQKNSYKINGAIKYDFSDIFEINAGFFSAKIDNYHYYEDIAGDNRFTLTQINEVNQLGGFLSILINAKKYGELFADFQFQDVRNVAGFKIPYNPLLNGNISYGYLFNFGLYSKLKLTYLSGAYTDLQNKNKLPSYIDLGLYLKYNFIESLALTLDFQNIFDNNNYLLKGYKEKPLDVIVGIEYRW